jgi:DNA polymerase
MNTTLRAAVRRACGVGAIYGVDFETHWSTSYTLRKIPTTEYVNDPRFEMHLAAVQKDTWAAPRVMDLAEFRKFVKTVDWQRSGMLCHNTAFDGYIMRRHFGIEAGWYFDTMSMARAIMPVTQRLSLDALCRAFKLPGKRNGAALSSTQGKRWKDFTAAEKKNLRVYAGDDIWQTWELFDKFGPFIPVDELHIIDATIGMYARPRLYIDAEKTSALHKAEQTKKQNALDKVQAAKKDLTSRESFADRLRALGVEPPVKINKKGLLSYAFSKQDYAFKQLLAHANEKVRDLVRARLTVSSSILETRALRMTNRSSIGAQPLFLNYWGAKTGRWSGGDKANWQNLTRGSDLRTALYAPKGHKLLIADLSQIEARLTAWLAKQTDLVNVFATGGDPYKLAASRIYGKPISEISKDERFIGKIAVLMLGYGAGWERYANTLRVGAMGPAVDISDADAQRIVKTHRASIPYVVAMWKALENSMRIAYARQTRVEYGPIVFAASPNRMVIELPGGMCIRYDEFTMDEHGMSYTSEVKGSTHVRTRLYGGLITENVIQALARRVIAEAFIAIRKEMPYAHIALTVHDEIVSLIKNAMSKRALKHVTDIMTRTPAWCPGAPIGVDAHISERYDK